MRILLNVDDGSHWHGLAVLVGHVARAGGDHVDVVSTQWSAAARATAFATAKRLLDMPEGRVGTIGEPGIVEEALPRVARKGGYDLVALGPLGGLDRLTYGLVSALLVRRIPTSVLVVRGRLGSISRVLVLTAGPRHGGQNLRLAARIARPFDAEVVAMHVLSQMPLTFEGEAEVRSLEEHFLELDLPEARHLAEAREDLARRGVRGDVKVRVGGVVDTGLAEAVEGRYGLLVFGAHASWTGAEGLLYEDLAGLLVRASPVSFLLVRDPPAD